MVLIPGDTLDEMIWEEKDLALHRGRRSSDGSPILLELPVRPDAAPQAEARIEREYSFRAELEPAWALLPVRMERNQGLLSLVFDDPGGNTLSRLLPNPRTTTESLRIAIGLASAIGKLHSRGFVHKDIKPAHVFLDPSGTVRLRGFGLLSRLPRERQEPSPPERISGSLEYMSPEQTGRMNRSIDSRSDLYSLGITLYELFTGILPFTAHDPLEWVHCHIARLPVPPNEREGAVPAPVSAVVMKLLAKMAEERYQTAAGVERDLRLCLEAWENRKAIEPFALGAGDVPARLLVPEKLYGREREGRELLEAFGRVEAGGSIELMLVSGYSGIGKSSLFQDLQRAIIRPKGLFAGGKLGSQGLDVPYGIFTQAFQSLVGRILAGSEAEVAAWKQAILAEVGLDGRVLTDLIPELELVLGPQREVPVLSLVEARNRLHGVFVKFLGAFARPEHPLVLFLDDLQWLDGASLSLFEHVATHPDVRHLLLVGGYRDAEVGPSHPLARVIETIRRKNTAVTEIRLLPLGPEHLVNLITETLHCTRKQAEPLAENIHGKTGGNPFFTIQFLHFLEDERLIEFDASRAAWTWDLERIRSQRITDNVAEMVVGKLERISDAALEAVQRMACLGSVADSSTLARILGRSEKELRESIWPAVVSGMVMQSEDKYRFLHDRVREAAYSLIPPGRRAGIHLAIGRILLEGRSQESIEEDIFLLVDQFNRGLEGVTETAEKNLVRRLNAFAGRKAMASAAFGSASTYLSRARSLLTAGSWDTGYPETLSLFLDGAESDFMSGNQERADTLFDAALAHVRSRTDRSEVYRRRAKLNKAAGRYQEALDACLEGLRLLDVSFPRADDGEGLGAAVAGGFARFMAGLAGRQIADLADAPPAADVEARAVIALTAEGLTPAYYGKSPYLPLLALTGASVTLEHGPAPDSAILYNVCAFLLAAGGEIRAAQEYSEMALRLNKKLGDAAARGSLLVSYGTLVLWTRPFAACVAILEEAYRTCERVGDVTGAGNAAMTALWARLEAGEPIDRIVEAGSGYLAFARRTGNETIYHMVRLFLRFLETFRSTESPARNPGEGEEIAVYEQGGFSVGIAMFHIQMQISAYTFGRYEEALSEAGLAELNLTQVMFTVQERNQPFFHALAAAALHGPASPDRRKELAGIIAAKLELLRKMAESGPAGYANRLALIEAEVARIEGRELAAMRLYDQAIQSARENGLIHREALANEVAARFYFDRGFETIAQTYLKNAQVGYLRWGATGKARQLQRLYPGIKLFARANGEADVGVPLEDLDLLAVIKASRAVSGELVLERFIEGLLTLMLESAGAERGALLRPRDGEFVVEAEAKSGRERIEVRILEDALSADRFPASMVRYAARTREQVLVDDATAPNPYSEDPYCIAHRPRSVLVLPLVKQAAVVAVLYLENRLAAAAFTPGQVAVVRLLAAQAAVSFENARLYRSLERAEERFSKAFRNSPSPMAIIRQKDQVVLDANARFLETYGFAREEFLGRPFQEMGLIERAEAERLDALVTKQGYLHEEEVSSRNKVGKSLSLLSSLESIELGGEACALVTHIDITSRKETESQLRQSQKMEAIGSLAGGVAHDFNNVLTVINGYSELALMGKAATSQDYKYLNTIRNSGERAAGLTRQLLAFSRQETIQTQVQSLNDIVAGMEDMLRRLIEENVEIIIRLDPQAGSVNVDKGQVVQILMNLVVNARDSMPAGGRILVETRPARLDKPTRNSLLVAPPGMYVELAVMDTGTGMSPEIKTRIFEPFYTTKAIGKGTGLGLSVVYGVVKQLGGGIALDTAPGKGTTFHIFLPEANETKETRKPESDRPDIPESFRGTETILVVEDEEMVREFIKQALQSQGYQVLESRNGVEALRLLHEAEHPPDLVLTDLIMPNMGGRELAAQLRIHRADLPVLYTSGYSKDMRDLEEAEANAEYFITKPFGPSGLARKVREVLDRSR